MNRIVLIGFPGCGKSTHGKRLASRLGLDFYDTDAEFEKYYHISIVDFFSKYGESAFRTCERQLLLKLLDHDHCVISTGGGTPCFGDNMNLILQRSLSVYIKLSAVSLQVRLSQSKKRRPLLMNMTDDQLLGYVEETLASRENDYSRANLIVKGEDLTAEKLYQVVMEAKGKMWESSPAGNRTRI